MSILYTGKYNIFLCGKNCGKNIFCFSYFCFASLSSLFL
ncbi:hypothetical protein M067_4333 [Bacteroides fragilis str. J-143-4]|nr:hypothetical protein M067_4333 [Bacteroides fragilis str. J-143-4]